MIAASSIVEEARGWKGTRWVHQGRARAGVDCAGLVIRVCHGVGLPAEDMQGYRRTPNAREFIEHIRRQTGLSHIGPVPGAIGIFRESVFPCHTGIFSMVDDKIYLIHAEASAGKVVEAPFTHDLPKRLVEIRLLNGVDYT